MKVQAKGLLFDMDGVLISSIGSVVRCWRVWAKMYNIPGWENYEIPHGTRAIDIILCDVDCPGELGGFGLSRWVRTQGLPAKVILAASVERAAQKAGDLCEDGPQVRKPYDHALLLDRIKRMLAMRERSGQP